MAGAAATSGSGGDVRPWRRPSRCERASALKPLKVLARLHKILVFKYELRGEGGHGILPAPLTAPPANAATLTLAPAVARQRRPAGRRRRANGVDRRATRGLLHGSGEPQGSLDTPRPPSHTIQSSGYHGYYGYPDMISMLDIHCIIDMDILYGYVFWISFWISTISTSIHIQNGYPCWLSIIDKDI